MELDMYKVYELLLKHPQIEMKIDIELNGLQIRVINYEDLTQKFVILKPDEMLKMRGGKPIMDIVSNMIERVANGEGY